MKKLVNHFDILVVDDEYGRDTSLQADFERLTGISDWAKANHVTYDIKFETGQDNDGNNDYSKILDVVNKQSWSLILLDLHFKSTSNSNEPFGSQVYMLLNGNNQELPIVILTGEVAASLPTELPEDVPYLSKEAMGLIGEEKLQFDNLNDSPESGAKKARIIWRNWRNLVIYGFFFGKGPKNAIQLNNLQKRKLLSLDKEVASSDTMLQVFYKVFVRASPDIRDDNLLLLGETGTGKQILAEYYHRMTQKPELPKTYTRKTPPLVAQEVTALTDTIFESMLFGAKKGSYTGCIVDQVGLVTSADNGTLFLDEIGDLSIGMQNKLRRLLENREYRELGSTKKEASIANCRFVFATNQNIFDEKIFKPDLYYRMGFPITVPQLHEHPEDIELLVAHFTTKNVTISPEALLLLKMYRFPGNIRELKFLIENICAQKSPYGRIGKADIEEVLKTLVTYSDPILRNTTGSYYAQTDGQVTAVTASDVEPAVVETNSYKQLNTAHQAINTPITVQAIAAHLGNIVTHPLLDCTEPGAILLLEDAFNVLRKAILEAAIKRTGGMEAALSYLYGPLLAKESVKMKADNARRIMREGNIPCFKSLLRTTKQKGKTGNKKSRKEMDVINMKHMSPDE